MYVNTCSCWLCFSGVPWLRQQTPEDNILAGTILCLLFFLYERCTKVKKISKEVLWTRKLLYSCSGREYHSSIWEIGIVSFLSVRSCRGLVFNRSGGVSSGRESFVTLKPFVLLDQQSNSGLLTFCTAPLSSLLLFLSSWSQPLSSLKSLYKGLFFSLLPFLTAFTRGNCVQTVSWQLSLPCLMYCLHYSSIWSLQKGIIFSISSSKICYEFQRSNSLFDLFDVSIDYICVPKRNVAPNLNTKDTKWREGIFPRP